MQIDWHRPCRNEFEKKLTRRCHLAAIRFLQNYKDPPLLERYGEATELKLDAIQTPIILNTYDALETGEIVEVTRDQACEEFLRQHGVDWSFLTTALIALTSNEAIRFAHQTEDSYGLLPSKLIREHNNLHEDYDHSKPLDVHTWSEHPEVNTFINEIYKAYFADTDKREVIAKKHLKVVLLDLYVTWSIDPTLKIAMSRDHQDYRITTEGQTNRYNKLHLSKKIIEVADRLEEVGLIDIVKGFLDRHTGAGRHSRICPKQALIEKFKEARFSPLDIDPHWGEECIILREQKTKSVTRNGVRKKETDNVPKQYRDNANTNRMRTVLTAYNDLLRRTYIDIPTLKDPFIVLGKNAQGNPIRLSVNQADKYVRRIFNRGSWKKGGRFWGGWWQRCPKQSRADIFINDQPISEIDYSGIHIVILYAQQGIQYWQEIGTAPYQIDPPAFINDPDRLRDIAKNLMLVALNAKNEKAAFGAFRQAAETGSSEKHLKDEALKQVLDRLRDKHQRIADKFASDAGIDLMNTDSQITEKIIQHFTNHEVPILTIHDSYLVPFGMEQELKESMISAFQEVTGIENVKLKEETHNPLALEPQSLEDAQGFDTRAWELAVQYRPNPQRTERYKYHYGQFQDWLTRSAEAQANG